jgi:hypothetical protein
METETRLSDAMQALLVANEHITELEQQVAAAQARIEEVEASEELWLKMLGKEKERNRELEAKLESVIDSHLSVENQLVKAHAKLAKKREFYSGAICALLPLVIDGYDSHVEVILESIGGLDDIRQIALEEGDTGIVRAVDDLLDKRRFLNPKRDKEGE